jgi:hypothetical protein
MLPLTVRHYDYDFDARVTKNGTLLFGDAVTAYQESNEIIPFKFRHPGEFDREIIINILGLFGMSALRATRQQQMQRYIELNAELLKELRKVYHLKEKKR